METMPCARCSAPMSAGDQFCPRCGARVTLIASPAPQIVTLGDKPGVPRPAAPAGPTSGQMLADRLAALSAKPRNELAALILTGLGGAVALVSFILPWANDAGLAIGSMGTTGSPPQPGAWAFDTPAGWPLFLVTLLLLACALGGERLRGLMPALAPVIRRLTEIVAPLALGSGLLGVTLLYLTLPWGCGSGPMVLAVGACLLIAASMVALFFPSAPPVEDRSA